MLLKDHICATKRLKTDVYCRVDAAQVLWVTCQVYAECVNAASDNGMLSRVQSYVILFGWGFWSDPGMCRRALAVTSPSSVRLPGAEMMTKTEKTGHDL